MKGSTFGSSLPARPGLRTLQICENLRQSADKLFVLAPLPRMRRQVKAVTKGALKNNLVDFLTQS